MTFGGLRFARPLLVGTALLQLFGASAADAAEREVARWNWLKNTLWYVPPGSLPAVITSASRPGAILVSDQTVYSIDDFKHGYFWGYARVQFWRSKSAAPVPPSPRPSCFRMVGSVTPEGSLNLSFAPLGNGDRTSGAGVMRFTDQSWAMELQMTSGDRVQITHWAYMRACPQSGQCPLPGITATAQEFLAPCRQ